MSSYLDVVLNLVGGLAVFLNGNFMSSIEGLCLEFALEADLAVASAVN